MRKWPLGAAALVLAGGLASTGWLFMRPSGAPPGAPTAVGSSPTSTSTAATLPTADVQNIEQRLPRQDPADVAPALSSAVRDAYLRQPVAVLPAGSTIAIDASKLQVDGNLASVPAAVSGPAPGAWTLLLSRENGAWLVYGTSPE